jgi:hypothetical protein
LETNIIAKRSSEPRTEGQRKAQAAYYQKNKQKIIKASAARGQRLKEEDPEAYKADKRKRRMKNRYGIVPAQFDKIFIAQGSVCAVCKTEVPTAQGWHVDHCHNSNSVRGVLCGRCNAGLGYFKDDTGFLSNAISYLQNPPAYAILH